MRARAALVVTILSSSLFANNYTNKELEFTLAFETAPFHVSKKFTEKSHEFGLEGYVSKGQVLTTSMCVLKYDRKYSNESLRTLSEAFLDGFKANGQAVIVADAEATYAGEKGLLMSIRFKDRVGLGWMCFHKNRHYFLMVTGPKGTNRELFEVPFQSLKFL